MATTATASQASSRRCGSREPSIRVVDEYHDTLGNDAASIAEYVGIDLLGWQRDVANDFLAVDESGKWAHGRNCLSVPRQNGKSYLVIAICLYLMLVKNFKVAYTAQNYATVLDIFDRFKRIFGTKANDQFAAYPELNEMVLRVRGTASREGIELKHVVDDEGRGFDPCISFSTRTESSLRGQSYDVLVIDEAQCCTSGQFSSIGPVTKSGPAGNSMHLYLGTPETPTGRGEIFGNVRRDALSESHERTCWVEWGVDRVGDVMDSDRWYETNPSLGILGDETEMRSAAGTMNAFDFAQEYMGHWSSGAAVSTVISDEDWSACRVDAPPNDGTTCYGIKFLGDEYALSVCRRDGDTRFVELLFHEGVHGAHGLRWLAEWITERRDRVSLVAIDGKDHSLNMLHRLEKTMPRKSVVIPKVAECVAANAAIVSYVSERNLAHCGQEQLAHSATRAAKRSISGGGFGWSQSGDASPIPIESAALAVWAADNTKRKPGRKPRFNI